METLIRFSYFQFLPLILFFLLTSPLDDVSARLRKNFHHPQQTIISDQSVSNDFETFYYTQTLDHFNYKPESYTTFKQRYVMNFQYWSGPNTSAPIFVFFGAEENIDDDVSAIGFLTDNASHFKALLLYIEHRYYGESIPFGSISKEAMKNASYLGYFNSAQAIADYAAIIMHVKKKYSSDNSPVIVIGGSYGGLLASWFRLKYPHIASGALASSAPILYFDDTVPQVGFYSIVSKDFKETSESCYKTISESWAEIEKVASNPDGLSILSKKFKTCTPLKRSSQLKDYLDSMYIEAAQFDHPPSHLVSIVCDGIDGAPQGSDVLGRIFGGVVAYQGEYSCYDINYYNNLNDQSSLAWIWQTCSELVIRIGHERNTMFPPTPFNLKSYIEHCKSLFGVSPQPHWISTYYGGHDLKLMLHRFASNIIFSNGLRDPYSSGGVLENISDSIVAVSTINGSHCLDIQKEKPSDPHWLVMQRKSEVHIIEGWISKFYADLFHFNDSK